MSIFPGALSLAMVACAVSLASADQLLVGFAEQDITPEVGPNKRAVWLAGYGFGRKATGIHDRLMARAVVLSYGGDKVAIASVDLIGLQNDVVLRIREQLAGFRHVTVASTHNHEGPDVIGIWGPTPIQRGVSEDYLKLVIQQVVAAIRLAEKNAVPATAAFGTAEDDSLLDDSRKPLAKDGALRTLKFSTAEGRTAGLLVQWNCHPESLGSRNTLITADFPWATVQWLKKQHDCPVVYISGAVGGLMGPPDNRIRDSEGKILGDGDFEYARLLGEEVGKLADKAIAAAAPIRLTPFNVAAKRIAVPVSNRIYRLGRQTGVLKREGRIWLGEPEKFGEVVVDAKPGSELAIVSEVSCLRLGELSIVNLPGELYPELVYGKFQEPADPAADFPEAPLEPTVAELMPTDKWLLFGLASDELGYIIPKRQWDEQSPFCYDRPKSQYGEINSCGPETAPVLMQALSECVRALK